MFLYYIMYQYFLACARVDFSLDVAPFCPYSILLIDCHYFPHYRGALLSKSRGRSKTSKQFKDQSNNYLTVDNVEMGVCNRITP